MGLPCRLLFATMALSGTLALPIIDLGGRADSDPEHHDRVLGQLATHLRRAQATLDASESIAMLSSIAQQFITKIASQNVPQPSSGSTQHAVSSGGRGAGTGAGMRSQTNAIAKMLLGSLTAGQGQNSAAAASQALDAALDGLTNAQDGASAHGALIAQIMLAMFSTPASQKVMSNPLSLADPQVRCHRGARQRLRRAPAVSWVPGRKAAARSAAELTARLGLNKWPSIANLCPHAPHTSTCPPARRRPAQVMKDLVASALPVDGVQASISKYLAVSAPQMVAQLGESHQPSEAAPDVASAHRTGHAPRSRMVRRRASHHLPWGRPVPFQTDPSLESPSRPCRATGRQWVSKGGETTRKYDLTPRQEKSSPPPTLCPSANHLYLPLTMRTLSLSSQSLLPPFPPRSPSRRLPRRHVFGAVSSV